MPTFNRVVLSSDLNPEYFEFCELTVGAWQKFFPEITVSLAIVADRLPHSLCDLSRKPGVQVALFHPIPGVPTPNHAKMARYYLAAEFPTDVCLIHDIDTVPLQRKYTIELLSHRVPGRLLAVGAEVFAAMGYPGKFQASHMTAEGSVFKAMMAGYDPGSKMFDDKEDWRLPPTSFCDESVIRAQVARNNVPVQYMARDVNVYAEWADRSWWELFDEEKLHEGGYIECNMPRPYRKHKKELQPVVDYVSV